MKALAELLAVRDALNGQLGEGGIDYGPLGDASRRLRALNMTAEQRAARLSGETAEDVLGLLQTLRALRAILDALIDGNRATWESVALLAIMVELVAEALEEEWDEDAAPSLPAAAAEIRRAAAASFEDLAAAHMRRFEFYGRRSEAQVSEYIAALAARIAPAPAPAGPPPDNVAHLPGRCPPFPNLPRGGAA